MREGVARAPDAGDAQLEAAHIEYVEGDVVAFAGLAEKIRSGYLAIGKNEGAGG